MNTIWILVADQAEARFYATDRVAGKLTLVNVMTNKEGAAHARDLTSDAPGRVHDRRGSARHSMEPDTGVKEEGRRRFVKQIVERLESAHLRGDFERLVLLAAPAVLGVIRKTLSTELARAVVKEIPKDVIGQSLQKIQTQLQRSFELK